MINYKGPGILHAYAPANLADDLYLIVVELPGAGSTSLNYVASLYECGASSWVNGHYFERRSEAVAYFTWSMMERMPFQHVAIHPGSQAMANDLSRLIGVLKEVKGNDNEPK